jgi:dTDP-4-dehydrorhamnose reductase
MSSVQSVAPTLFSGVGGVLGCGFSQYALPRNSHYFSRNSYRHFLAQHHQLDLTDVGAVSELIHRLHPQTIVHAACISSAQQCAAEPLLCQRINVDSTQEVADAAQGCGAHLIYISTEQVFDGSAASYAEGSAPSASTAYGQSKAAAEDIVLNSGGVVVRLPLLLGAGLGGQGGGVDFSLLRALADNLQPSLFVDEWRAPVAADEIWPMINMLGERKMQGVFHLAGADVVTRYELGQLICKAANVAADFRESSIADFQGPRRSPRLVLTSGRAQQQLGYRPPSLWAALLRLHSSSKLPLS